MNVYKKVTHALAAVVVAAAGFFLTPAGQSLLHQYPVLVPVASGLGALALLYHAPKAS
jgi:hypothetical protein